MKEQILEVQLCTNSFLYFLHKYVKIVQAPKPGQTGSGGVQRIELWPHIVETVNTFMEERLISVLKARQIGLSTILAAYVVWYALFHEGAIVLLFSKGKDEAKELLAKAYRILDQLPDTLKEKPDPESTEEMGFPTMKSMIKALPSTTSAGIGYTASIIVCDEHAEHEYASQNYVSSKPTIDGGGQFISVFTEDAWDKNNLATHILEDALGGWCETCKIEFNWEQREGHEEHDVTHKNDFKVLFFPWDVVPGRDQEWYDHVERNIPEDELKGLTKLLFMRKNYPRDIEEALSMPETVAAFDLKVVKQMEEVCHGKINFDWEEFDCDVVSIYKPYIMGESYVASSDVADGTGADYSVTVVMNKAGEVVADILSNRLKPDELAYHSVQLLKYYKNPQWWPEHNLYGRTVIRKAVELGYRRLGIRGEPPFNWNHITDVEIRRLGFFTEEKSRADLFGVLIPAFNGFQIRLYNRQSLEHFRYVVHNSKNKGKIEAVGSKHDDYAIATGICVLKLRDTKSNTPIEPIRTLDFGKQENAVIKRWTEVR